MGVVGAGHRLTALGEQLGLAGQVFREILVLRSADVVRGEVEEHRRVVGDAIGAVQLQGLGGDLHDQMGAAGRHRLGKKAVQVQGLRRSVQRVGDLLRA